jgi:hypothetical protein
MMNMPEMIMLVDGEKSDETQTIGLKAELILVEDALVIFV